MGTFVEDFLIRNFSRMPLPVRVFTYLFVLFLFTYLLLAPRFINGELIVQNKSGGFTPYRSGELKMIAEGRVFKFKVNEEGVWSAPIISRLPHTVEMQIYVVDADSYFPVKFRWADLWTRDSFKLLISGEPPGVRLVSAGDGTRFPVNIVMALRRLTSLASSSALAGVLELPPNLKSTPLDPSESKRIREKVFLTISQVTGKDVREINLQLPLTGPSAPSFVQRIQIIERLEREFGFKIPDEHWNYLTTVGQLVDYVQKRQLWLRQQKSAAPSPASKPRTTTIPPRPVFKR